MNAPSINTTCLRSCSGWLVITLLLSVLPGRGYGQWKAVNYKSITTSRYSLNGPEAGNLKLKKVSFPERYDCNAVEINKKIKVEDSFVRAALKNFEWVTNSAYGLVHELEQPVKLNPDAGKLLLNLYAENVERCIVIFEDVNHKWLAKEFLISENGFQMPIQTFLLSWDTGAPERAFSGEAFKLNRLAVLYQPAQPTKKSTLLVGNLELVESVFGKEGRVFPWVDSLVCTYRTSNAAILNEYSAWSLDRLGLREKGNGLPSFEGFCQEQGFITGLTAFESQLPQDEERTLLEKLFTKAIDLYPFYQDKQLDKSRIQKQIQDVFDGQHENEAAFLTQLKRVVGREFKDGHFEIILPRTYRQSTAGKAKYSQGPLRLRKIADDVVVAAVYNEEYQSVIPYGSKVLSIDGKPVTPESDVAKMLVKEVKDSLRIAYSVSGDQAAVRETTVLYSKPLKVGSNFSPTHGELKMRADSIMYLRINNWVGDCYYKLINRRAEIAAAKGLVIDLRGNGGGYSNEVYRVLSLFIDNPEHIGQREYPWFKETISVFPAVASFRYPSNMQVSILVDGSTACASEIFMIGMKRRKNTTIVGDSKTRGAIASPTLFRFPSGLMVKMHTTIRKYQFDPTIYREGKGIEPDVWISRTHARDLFPYEDKVLRAASALITKQ